MLPPEPDVLEVLPLELEDVLPPEPDVLEVLPPSPEALPLDAAPPEPEILPPEVALGLVSGELRIPPEDLEPLSGATLAPPPV